METEDSLSIEAPPEPMFYAIDPSWYEDREISLSHILKLRHLPKCPNQSDGDNAKKRTKSKAVTGEW